MSTALDNDIVTTLRSQFPVLDQQVNDYPLVYFDNAATTQKPKRVIEAITKYYEEYNSNIHRGIHTLAEKATVKFEETREKAKTFINASDSKEIVFTRGTSESINLVAQSLTSLVNKGDEIIISGLEHHSNLVPWQALCERTGAQLKVIPIDDTGTLQIDTYYDLLSEKTRIVAVNHASNALGTINPVKEIISKAHEVGAWVLIDGAQAAPHLEIDVQSLDADFYALSAHKMYGPTGIGILYGKADILNQLPPYQFGGEMIKNVSFEKTTYNDIPYKFEAGTPHIEGVIAFGEAIDFVSELGKETIRNIEEDLLEYATKRLSDIPEVKLVGTAENKVSVVSFIVDGIHPFDIGQMLDARGVAVRTGHHCTEPIMDRFGIEGTIRASFGVYNTRKEIDQMIEGIDRIIKFLKP